MKGHGVSTTTRLRNVCDTNSVKRHHQIWDHNGHAVNTNDTLCLVFFSTISGISVFARLHNLDDVI